MTPIIVVVAIVAVGAGVIVERHETNNKVCLFTEPNERSCNHESRSNYRSALGTWIESY